jgi:hypothetical protein
MKTEILKSPALQDGLAEKNEKSTGRNLTVADLWNIHRERRVRSLRRYIGQ